MGILKETAKGSWFKQNLKGLSEEDCQFTSCSTWDYNCVGYAAGDFRWWHPEDRREHYWPPGVKRGPKVASYVAALNTVGFEDFEPQSIDPEPGYEKVVVFHSGGLFRHVAIIWDGAKWKSKLGEYEDIEHPPIQKKMGKFGLLYKVLRRDSSKYPRQALPGKYQLSAQT